MVYVNYRIAASGRAPAKVRASHDPRDAFERVRAVAMDVAAQSNLNIVLFQQIEDHKPIGNVLVDWVMGDEDQRLVGIVLVFESLVQPPDVLRSPVAVAHFHQRTLMQADKAKTAELKHKPVLVPEAGEVGGARFGPLGVVIARHDVAGDFQAIQDFFRQSQLFKRAKLGDIARDDYKAEIGLGINVSNRSPKVLFTGRRADMGIA